MRHLLQFVALIVALAGVAAAQVPPSAGEAGAYDGLMQAAHIGDLEEVQRLLADGVDPEARDRRRRTALHIAAHGGHADVVTALAEAGADMNALEFMAYDAVTIAVVADDLAVLRAALAGGNRADLVTSPYDGTALIAAAHLGHWRVVEMLIEAGAPLNHINNLGWTALIEAVVLGDGGPDHQRTVAALLAGGADPGIADGRGATPLELARVRGYDTIAALIEAAGQ